MSIARRKFLKMGALSVVSAGFVLASVRTGMAQNSGTQTALSSSDIPIEAQKDPVFWFKPETFKPYVGGFFEAPNVRGEMIAMQLVSLKIFKPSKSALRVTRSQVETESFTLLFEAEAQLPPFTSIHRIKHPSLGEFHLFLTPLKGESGELLYEAVFNHIQ
jgi:hypothetical protein